MESKDLLFDPSDPFDITSVEQQQNQIIITLKTNQPGCACPLCNVHSESVHCYYIRKFKDLPAFGNKVVLHLRSRKFYCYNPGCSRKVFTERFADHFASYKRVTERLQEKLLKVALLTGGNCGEKLCRTLSIDVSSSTLIRMIHRQPLPPATHPVAIGIDDWAYRKGVRYGTAIVDIEKHTIIDLLPDRERDTVENWLKQYPGIKIITRDRYAHYANATKKILPSATHVADRFHLLQNLTESLKHMLERHYRLLNKPFHKEKKHKPGTEKRLSNLEQRFLQVKKLQKKGKLPAKISVLLKMDLRIVKHYIALDKFPKRTAHTKNHLSKFESYIRMRVADDPGITIMQLHTELKKLGYKNSYSTSHRLLQNFISNGTFTDQPILPKHFWTPNRTSVLLYKKPSLLNDDEKEHINNLCVKSPDISRASKLAHIFREMMEVKNEKYLYLWTNLVTKETLDIKELKNFANGLHKDYDAVSNALSLPYSNGQVEGQINKLKTIKRQMYGRASFEFLRRRLLLSNDLNHQN